MQSIELTLRALDRTAAFSSGLRLRTVSETYCRLDCGTSRMSIDQGNAESHQICPFGRISSFLCLMLPMRSE